MCNDRIWILLTRKLSGEATLTELKELDLLLETDLQQQSTIEKISGVWNNRSTPDDDFMEATYLAHLERTKEKGVVINHDEPLQNDVHLMPTYRRRSTIKWVGLTTIILAGVIAGFLFINSKKSIAADNLLANNREVITKKGNRTKLKLPDGTDVWLNAGSKLNYAKNFEGNTREVYLTGEGYFDVAHNAAKPFIIHTSKIDIKVLGTQFNVKAYENDKTTETSLIRGSVEVFLKDNPAHKYLLRPNEKLVLNNEVSNSTLQKLPVQSTGKKLEIASLKIPAVAIKQLSFFNEHEYVESSWVKNILSFDDEQFGEVAKKMERWYDVNFVFRNKHWEKKHISGSFESENLEQALEALKYSTGFNFKINQKTVTIF